MLRVLLGSACALFLAIAAGRADAGILDDMLSFFCRSPAVAEAQREFAELLANARRPWGRCAWEKPVDCAASYRAMVRSVSDLAGQRIATVEAEHERAKAAGSPCAGVYDEAAYQMRLDLSLFTVGR